MHKTLERQLNRLKLSKQDIPSDMAAWKDFLQSVENFYQNADHDRYLLEQALNISSEEMQERWERINKLLDDNEKHISILKSQNKLLSLISEDSDFEIILQILVNEMLLQLDLSHSLVFQKDLATKKFYISSACKIDNPHFFEISYDTDTADNILSFIDINSEPQYSLTKNQKELNFLGEFFATSDATDQLWYIPILDNSARYPSFLFLSPKEKQKPSVKELEILHSLIQVIHIITYNLESKRRLEEEQVKVISAGKKAALGEMAGGIAHEINNPLAIISGQTQKLKLLAKIGKIDEESLNDSADKILKTIDRLSRIVYALRAFSRDDTKVNKAVLNVVEILDDSLALCSEKIKNSGVELITKYETDQLYTYCNSVQISQVIVNLISNAYDAINKQKEPWIKIEVNSEETEIIIRVTDSGHGIPKALQDKIMQPFFTTKEVGHGTGIGLSLSHGIIKEHNGSLEFNNEAENTQFIIHLQLQEKPQEVVKAAS